MLFVLGRVVYNYTVLYIHRKNIYCKVQGAKHSPASRGALLLRPLLTWGAFRTTADQKGIFLTKHKEETHGALLNASLHPSLSLSMSILPRCVYYSIWFFYPAPSPRGPAPRAHTPTKTHTDPLNRTGSNFVTGDTDHFLPLIVNIKTCWMSLKVSLSLSRGIASMLWSHFWDFLAWFCAVKDDKSPSP